MTDHSFGSLTVNELVEAAKASTPHRRQVMLAYLAGVVEVLQAVGDADRPVGRRPFESVAMSNFMDAATRMLDHGWKAEGAWRIKRGGMIVYLEKPDDRVWFCPDGFIDTEIEDTGTVDELLAEVGWRIRCWENGEEVDGSDTIASMVAVLGQGTRP